MEDATDAASDPNVLVQGAPSSRPVVIAACILVLIAFACAAIILWVVGNLIFIDESDFKHIRNRLPKSATNVREKAYDWFPDFVYLLRADMPESDFHELVESQGEMEYLYEDLGIWFPDATPPWWTPAMAGVRSYHWNWRDGQLEMHLQYYKGTMYMVYTSQ